ncbi:MAG: hypothetical protein K0U80_08885 [Actinomycetia bacterium]|nr:hypothetical protein [Actinomycetes bacterium]
MAGRCTAMGLKTGFAHYAARQPHVLIAEAPGGWLQRAALERRALRWGWHLAENPADADVLAICGTPGPELTEMIGRVWDQLPGPRSGVGLVGPDTDDAEIDAALDRARFYLADTAAQRSDARERRAPHIESDTRDNHEMDHAAMDHAAMDHGAMDHAAMDHGDMQMAPSGIPLAGGGPDRDGLEMDVLDVRLGPVLRHWPAGLVVRCSLQGDLIVDAQAWTLDAGQAPPPPPRHARTEAARECDRLASLLFLAGWPHAGTRARRVRDLLLTTDRPALDELDALTRLVTRSRIFGWSMRGITDGHHARLARARALLTGWAAPADTATTPADLPERVVGREMAAARLVVAGLDVLEPTPAQPEANGG